MKNTVAIFFNLFISLFACAQQHADKGHYFFEFTGDTIVFDFNHKLTNEIHSTPNKNTIYSIYEELNKTDYQSVKKSLLDYKQLHNPDDWIFYQLIRKAAENISPKAENYYHYTIYKWFLLLKTGYHPVLSISDNVILLYVQSDDIVYNIPSHINAGKKFVCLNYHDYGEIDFSNNSFQKLNVDEAAKGNAFSYKISHIPEFPPSTYQEKEVGFEYYGHLYSFTIKLNYHIRDFFKNYPVSDYGMHFSIPISNQTYSSLIPTLKENLKNRSQKNGVDYLMRFTRYAFIFEKDTDQFGKEKRMSPEETLLYDRSDCEDRAALFFYLVKEIYNLPMIVLAYPNHVTIGVEMDKPVGATINYSGKKYVICEPTPQRQNVRMGQLMRSLRDAPYEIVYAYTPSAN